MPNKFLELIKLNAIKRTTLVHVSENVNLEDIEIKVITSLGKTVRLTAINKYFISCEIHF